MRMMSILSYFIIIAETLHRKKLSEKEIEAFGARWLIRASQKHKAVSTLKKIHNLIFFHF